MNLPYHTKRNGFDSRTRKTPYYTSKNRFASFNIDSHSQQRINK